MVMNIVILFKFQDILQINVFVKDLRIRKLVIYFHRHGITEWLSFWKGPLDDTLSNPIAWAGLPRTGYPAPYHVHAAFEDSQRGRLHCISGQFLKVLRHPHNKEVLSSGHTESLVFKFCAHCLLSHLWAPLKRAWACLLYVFPSGVYISQNCRGWKGPLETISQSRLSRPSCTGRHPGVSWMSSEKENPQLLCAACSSAPSPYCVEVLYRTSSTPVYGHFPCPSFPCPITTHHWKESDLVPLPFAP